jgi:hypothetical protein
VVFNRRFDFPLYIGNKAGHVFDLFSALTQVKEGEASLDRFEANSLLGERKVSRLTIDYGNAKVTYWVDLERGGIPLRVLQEPAQDGTKSLIIHDKLEFVASAGWIPRRRLEVIGERIFEELAVTDIDVKRKPEASVFRLDFPQPIGLVDQARRLSYSPRNSWSLLNLPGPSSPGARAVDLRPVFEPDDLPGELVPSVPWPIILAATFAVLFLLICAIAAYKFRHRTA